MAAIFIKASLACGVFFMMCSFIRTFCAKISTNRILSCNRQNATFYGCCWMYGWLAVKSVRTLDGERVNVSRVRCETFVSTMNR